MQNLSFHSKHKSKILGPKRSVKMTDRFTCTSENVIYCITCTLCNKSYTGETGTRLGDRSANTFEMLRRMTRTHLSQSLIILISITTPNNTWRSAAFPYIKVQGTTESRKIIIYNKNSCSKSAHLIPTVCGDFSFNYFSRCHVTTNSVAPPPLYKPHTTHNSSIHSDEGLALETSAFRIPVRWSIYNTNSVDKTKFFVYNSLTDAAPHFFRNYPL